MSLEPVEVGLAIGVVGYLSPGFFLAMMGWFGE